MLNKKDIHLKNKIIWLINFNFVRRFYVSVSKLSNIENIFQKQNKK